MDLDLDQGAQLDSSQQGWTASGGKKKNNNKKGCKKTHTDLEKGRSVAVDLDLDQSAHLDSSQLVTHSPDAGQNLRLIAVDVLDARAENCSNNRPQSRTADSAPGAATWGVSLSARPLAYDWYYCAQFIAKPKAACALRFSWGGGDVEQHWLMTSSIKPEVHNVSLRRQRTTEPLP